MERTTTDTVARSALKTYAERTTKDLATLAGVSERSIYHWRAGVRRPAIPAAMRLERATGGAVRVVDWVTQDEAQRLAAVPR